MLRSRNARYEMEMGQTKLAGVSVALECCAIVAVMWGLTSPGTANTRRRPQETRIRVETNLVRITVVALDPHGRAVLDLGINDFVVLDNGVPQKVSVFAPPRRTGNDRPSNRGSSRGLGAPESATPDSPAAANVLILLPGLSFTSRHYALRAVTKYLQSGVAETMRVGVADASGSTLPFTQAKDRIANFAQVLRGQSAPPPGFESWSFRQATKELCQSMKQFPGPKAIVVYTDFGRAASPGIWATQPSELLSAALDIGAAIYPVDARGVVPVIPFGDAASEGMPFDATIQSLGLLQESGDLLRLADETGGDSIGGNDAGAVFKNVERDVQSSYELGYYKSDLAHDGSFHSLSLKCERRGIRLRARAGYFAPVGGLSALDSNAQLKFVLDSDLRFEDVAIRFRPLSFPESGSPALTTSIGVAFRWPDDTDAQESAKPLSLIGTVQSPQHRAEGFNYQVLPQSQPVSSNLREVVIRMPLLNLTPGDTTLKVAARTAEGALGSAVLRLSVPQLTSTETRLSSLIISNRMESTANAADDDPFDVGETRILPNVSQTFDPKDILTFFARAIPAERESRISARLTVTDVFGRSVVEVSPEAPQIPDGPTRFGAPLVVRLPASTFANHQGPFSARLVVKARDTNTSRVEASFAVAPK